MKPISSAAFFVLFTCITGCVDREESITRGVGITHIADRVECDLKVVYQKYLPHYPWLKDWAASFNLTIKQEDVLGGAPGVGYRVPLSPNSQFGLDASIGLTSTGTRTLTTKRTVLLNNLLKYSCKDIVVSDSPLTHDLGLAEPFGDALSAYDKKDVINKEPDDLGYRLDFIARIGGHANPLVILKRFTGVGVDFTASTEKTNSLEIAFADARPKAPQEVFVVNFPAGGSVQGGATTPSIRRETRTRLPATGLGVTPDVRLRLDNTLQRLQLETLLPRRF